MKKVRIKVWIRAEGDIEIEVPEAETQAILDLEDAELPLPLEDFEARLTAKLGPGAAIEWGELVNQLDFEVEGLARTTGEKTT